MAEGKGRWANLTPEDRLWAKIDRRGPSECWLWTACRYPSGYGKFFLNGTLMTASRATFALTNGYLPPVVRHSCDNPPCCNPAHLVAGQAADNSADMRIRGRSLAGERQRIARLTAYDVREIRRLDALGAPRRALAERFGTTTKNIHAIVRRKSWRHI